MDLILGGFADNGLSDLSDADLVIYDQMLEENDHDLYFWASGQGEIPSKYFDILHIVMEKSDAI